jgi:hypothetical protein
MYLMQRRTFMPKLDQNLIFGERHDEKEIITFLIAHLRAFYARGYRTLVCELSGGLPIGQVFDASLAANATLQEVMSRVYDLVHAKSEARIPILGAIKENLYMVTVPGGHAAEFTALVTTALEEGFKVQLVDYITGEKNEKIDTLMVRVGKYNNYASIILERFFAEKWLFLTGDDHIRSSEQYKSTGIFEQLSSANVNVVTYRAEVLKNAIARGQLQNIDDLENVRGCGCF